jgi:hypothetical protein
MVIIYVKILARELFVLRRYKDGIFFIYNIRQHLFILDVSTKIPFTKTTPWF